MIVRNEGKQKPKNKENKMKLINDELWEAKKKYKILRENYHAMMRGCRSMKTPLKEQKKLFKAHQIEIREITSKFPGEFETI